MTYSLCAYQRGELDKLSSHWCLECPPYKEYSRIIKSQAKIALDKNKEKKKKK